MAPPSRSQTILIVEDDVALREFYRTVLRGVGFTVVAVEDGLDALRVLEGRLPDAIVLDLTLRRVGGRDVQQEVRSRAETRRIPIIVVTGTDASDLKGPNICVLRKPITPTGLIDAVINCLETSG